MPEGDGQSEAFREMLEERQRVWSAQDGADKISNRVTIRLAELYEAVSPDERDVFDAALADWVRSDDLGKLFDATVLIGQFNVRSALPAVQQAAASWAAMAERIRAHPSEFPIWMRPAVALAEVTSLHGLETKLQRTAGSE